MTTKPALIMPSGSLALAVAAERARRSSAGNLSAYIAPRSSVASTTRQPRAERASARAWAGNIWPPVPPAATTASLLMSGESAVEIELAARPIGAGALAHQGQGHAQRQTH